MMNRRDIYHSAMALVAEWDARARLHADLKRIELGSGDKDGRHALGAHRSGDR
jgi:hypothetical protein